MQARGRPVAGVDGVLHRVPCPVAVVPIPAAHRAPRG
jgi:hypothetical protein